MTNEILFFGFFLSLSLINLVAFYFGKNAIFVLVAVYSILMNLFVTKQFDLFWLAITGGNALYGAIFLLTDILSEHYDKKAAQKSVLIWFCSVLVFVGATQVLLAFQPNHFDFANESLHTLFALAPRIFLASILAYFIAQNLDIYLYQKIKKLSGNRFLFLRNNISTLISQAVDTLLFTLIGLTTFWWIQGVIDPSIFWEIVITTYSIKILISLSDTPFMYLSVWVKKWKIEKER